MKIKKIFLALVATLIINLPLVVATNDPFGPGCGPFGTPPSSPDEVSRRGLAKYGLEEMASALDRAAASRVVVGALEKKGHEDSAISRASRVIGALEKDYEDNVISLIRSRWIFRKSANVAEVLGNGFLYIGAGLSTVAGGVAMVGSQNIANILLFSSTACFATHIIFIGFAKCCAREEREREKQLDALAKRVGFSVVHLEPIITDDAVGSNGAKAKESEGV
ncbi:MAG: hypothetical protein WCN27_00680 [Alphaproteobacteria bacterium]